MTLFICQKKHFVHFRFNSSTVKIFLLISFLIYIFIVTWVLFISVDSTNRNSYFIKREIHLVPFSNTVKGFQDLYTGAYQLSKSQIPYYWYLLCRNIIGNIILFIPLGFFFPLLFKASRFRSIFLFALIASLNIEILQYLFMIGVCDIDDIIYNISGALFGFYSLQFLKAYAKRKAISF